MTCIYVISTPQNCRALRIISKPLLIGSVGCSVYMLSFGISLDLSPGLEVPIVQLSFPLCAI